MAKYRKTALIEAEQFMPESLPWPGGVVKKADSPTGYWIATLEGGHEVTPGDWIATGVKGEKWPIKADIFAKSYEPAE